VLLTAFGPEHLALDNGWQSMRVWNGGWRWRFEPPPLDVGTGAHFGPHIDFI
jgi:hypothetical protein